MRPLKTTWLFIAFLTGIAIHSALPFVAFSVFGMMVVALVLACAWMFAPKRFRFLVVCLALVFAGVLRFDVSLPRAGDGLAASVGHQTDMSGRVDEVIGISTFVSVDQADGDPVRAPGNVIMLDTQKKLTVGERVDVRCTPQPVGSKTWLPATELARRGVFFQCAAFVPWLDARSSAWWDVSAWLAAWRSKLSSRINASFPSADAHLLNGLLDGDGQFTSDEWLTYQRAGLAHIVAVSGAKVSMLAALLLSLALALKLRRRSALVVTLLASVWFTAFVGFGASVARAMLIGGFVLLAREVGRLPHRLHLLFLAAAVICAFNPWLFAYDAGFALSFLALFGVLVVAPWCEPRLRWIANRNIRSSVAATFAATALTVPYLAWLTGFVSLAGFVTNLVALPLTPLVMAWGAFAAALGTLDPFGAFHLFAYGLLEAIRWLAETGSNLPLIFSVDYPTSALIATYLSVAFVWLTGEKISTGLGRMGLKTGRLSATRDSLPIGNPNGNADEISGTPS